MTPATRRALQHLAGATAAFSDIGRRITLAEAYAKAVLFVELVNDITGAGISCPPEPGMAMGPTEGRRAFNAASIELSHRSELVGAAKLVLTVYGHGPAAPAAAPAKPKAVPPPPDETGPVATPDETAQDDAAAVTADAGVEPPRRRRGRRSREA